MKMHKKDLYTLAHNRRLKKNKGNTATEILTEVFSAFVTVTGAGQLA